MHFIYGVLLALFTLNIKYHRCLRLHNFASVGMIDVYVRIWRLVLLANQISEPFSGRSGVTLPERRPEMTESSG